MAHEEPTGQVVRMVVGFSDPAIIGCQQITDLGHNPHAVGAGNYQSKGAHQINSRSHEGAFPSPGKRTVNTVPARYGLPEAGPRKRHILLLASGNSSGSMVLSGADRNEMGAWPPRLLILL